MAIETRTAGLTVRDCIKAIAAGELTSEQLVLDCLTVIDASESDLHAWVHLDREQALSQARELDDLRRRGKPLGALHGIPVGIKDIFDTSDMPTERGSPVFAGRQPEIDATVIEKLREAGAVIMGKTVSTEFAFMSPSNTRNPHNPEHTPGGSSSGSAAAVGAGQVPLALGSQTNGSVVRPASFCGIYGFKPSRGVVSRARVLETSPSLDTIGAFARDPADLCLLIDVIKGYDRDDALSYLAPRPAMLEGYLSDVPIPPNFVWIDMPYQDRYAGYVTEGFEEIMSALAGQVDRVQAPQSFAVLLKCHKIIHEVEITRAFTAEREASADKISQLALDAMTRADSISDAEYQEAIEIKEAADAWFAEFYNDYDAILTPAALGAAPLFTEGTGDPICCTLWTLAGLPCITLPLLTDDDNLPVGVQLVGGLGEDDRLLRTSRWLLDHLQSAA